MGPPHPPLWQRGVELEGRGGRRGPLMGRTRSPRLAPRDGRELGSHPASEDIHLTVDGEERTEGHTLA